VEAPLPPEKRALVEACDAYVRVAPKGEWVREVSYKAARVLYDYNHLRDAAQRFHDVALIWPDDELCAVPPNLAIDALNLLEDWKTMLAWVDEFMKLPCVRRSAERERELEHIRDAVQLRLCTTGACF